jgi:deoxyhypusine synthase
MSIRRFVDHHFRHFNAATLRDAARAWETHVDAGGKMLLTMAGAMSTAEMGIVIADLIRAEKIHGICLTGANLEEDLFNLVAHDHYERIPDWRALSADQEAALRDRGMNRVTDTCIPEEEAMRRIEAAITRRWQAAESLGERYFPHEYLYQLVRSEELAPSYQIETRDSWLIAAAEADLPLWTPGWEDSTLGNMFVAAQVAGRLQDYGIVKSGLEAMGRLIEWYTEEASAESPIGFFQIGGGIAGDFPICVVPLIEQDLQLDVPYWGYFCQISDSTTSYGSYSGAVPNEKISWGKLDVDTPRFVIESDATIVFPLIARYLLED